MPNRQRWNGLRLCLMTLSLMSLILVLTSTARAEVALQNNQYVMSVEDGRDILELIDTQDAEIKTLWQSINKKDEQIDKLITVSEELVNKTYQLESKLVKEKAKRWGVGIFAGMSHNGEAVIGVGVTFDLIRF